MKTMKYFFGIAAVSVLTGIGINAQTPNQIVTQGSVHNYHVTTDHSGAGYTYIWSLTAPVAGNTISTPNTAATSITWGTPGTYTITLTETNSADGCSTPNQFIVLVLGQPVLQFTNANSSNCADQAMDLALNFTRTDGVTPITTADVDYFPLIINYTVNGNARTVTFNAGDVLVIPLSAADRADQDAFANYTIPVVITSATSKGGTVTIGIVAAHTNTVYDIPELNAIVAN
jgi:hypothetical protein